MPTQSSVSFASSRPSACEVAFSSSELERSTARALPCLCGFNYIKKGPKPVWLANFSRASARKTSPRALRHRARSCENQAGRASQKTPIRRTWPKRVALAAGRSSLFSEVTGRRGMLWVSSAHDSPNWRTRRPVAVVVVQQRAERRAHISQRRRELVGAGTEIVGGAAAVAFSARRWRGDREILAPAQLGTQRELRRASPRAPTPSRCRRRARRPRRRRRRRPSRHGLRRRAARPRRRAAAARARRSRARPPEAPGGRDAPEGEAPCAGERVYESA